MEFLGFLSLKCFEGCCQQEKHTGHAAQISQHGNYMSWIFSSEYMQSLNWPLTSADGKENPVVPAKCSMNWKANTAWEHLGCWPFLLWWNTWGYLQERWVQYSKFSEMWGPPSKQFMLKMFALCEQNITAFTCRVWDKVLQATDSRTAHCILLYCPSSCRRKVQLQDVNLHELQKNTTTACAHSKYAKITAKRSFLILDQKCPFSFWGCSQEPSVTVAKTKLISFFSPDNCHQTGISETYYSLSRRHLEPGLAQTLLFKRKVKKTDSTSK